MSTLQFDVVIVGSGAGGGTMAWALADSGARVLLLERGDHVPQEPENWDPAAVWRQLRYRTTERWVDERGVEFLPYTHYCVGGNTKFWGSVLYRLRERDFGDLEHRDGISPAWPIDYATLAPYYDRAERLFAVRGEAGVDPTDPPRGPFPFPAIPHAPRMAALVERLRGDGLHPSSLPLGLLRPGEPGGCQLCNTCNSFPCQAACEERRGSLLRDPGARQPRRDPLDRDAGPSPIDQPVRIAGRGGGTRARRAGGAGAGRAGRRLAAAR